MEDAPLDIMAAVGDRLRVVHVADTMNHRASHGLRYITNPPGNAVRVHQHLKVGDGNTPPAPSNTSRKTVIFE